MLSILKLMIFAVMRWLYPKEGKNDKEKHIVRLNFLKEKLFSSYNNFILDRSLELANSNLQVYITEVSIQKRSVMKPFDPQNGCAVFEVLRGRQVRDL